MLMTKYEILREFIKFLDEITNNEQQIDEYIDCMFESIKLVEDEKFV